MKVDFKKGENNYVQNRGINALNWLVGKMQTFQKHEFYKKSKHFASTSMLYLLQLQITAL